jgi:hypothetical protein
MSEDMGRRGVGRRWHGKEGKRIDERRGVGGRRHGKERG